jgi:DnaJ-class molecular chaperone
MTEMSLTSFVLLLLIYGISGFTVVWFVFGAIRTKSESSSFGAHEVGEASDATTGAGDDNVSQARMLFGVGPDVSPAVLRARYHEMIAKYHPDKTQHLGEEIQQLAQDKTQQIIWAYKLLSKE